LVGTFNGVERAGVEVMETIAMSASDDIPWDFNPPPPSRANIVVVVAMVGITFAFALCGFICLLRKKLCLGASAGPAQSLPRAGAGE
jgi:hypothetical protein